MTIVQDAFIIPDDIATGVATGLYRRIGSVVRYASGPNKGQIVKHLEPINLNATRQASGLGAKVLRFAVQHRKGVAIVSSVAAATGLVVFCFNEWKNREPEVLTVFRSVLKEYIDAIRSGDMDINKINALRKALENLKKHKDYESISLQLTAEEIELLMERVLNYTLKLAENNSVVVPVDRMNKSNNVLINLQGYLEEQKRVFEIAV